MNESRFCLLCGSKLAQGPWLGDTGPGDLVHVLEAELPVSIVKVKLRFYIQVIHFC